MNTIKKRRLLKSAVLVLAMSLVVTAYLGGIAPSPALAGGGAGHGGPFKDCWMTGGGSIFDRYEYGGRVTHGFVLHCTPRNSDNLQIVDHAINTSFHLQTLTSATCEDNPAIEPNPPDATFDTFMGVGTGRCKQPGGIDFPCTATWTFTDGGEVGGCVRDTALIVVRDENGAEVFSVSGDVDCGNHQAHSP
jgi:hypothetical protein